MRAQAGLLVSSQHVRLHAVQSHAAGCAIGARVRARAFRPVRQLWSFRKETGLAANLKTALVTGAGSGIGRASPARWPRWACASRLWVAIERNSRRLARLSRPGGLSLRRYLRHRRSVCGQGGRRADRRPHLGSIDVLVCNAGTNVRNRSLEIARSSRLGSDDRHQSHRFIQRGPPRASVDAPSAERAGDPDLLDFGNAGQHAGRGRLLGLEVRPGGAGHLPGT